MVLEDQYDSLPERIADHFNVMTSDSAYEEFFEVSGVPDIPEFNGKLSFLPVSPGYHVKVEHKEYAGGLQFQRKLMDDKKYGVFDSRTESLTKALRRTRDKKGARIYANSDSAAFDYMSTEEGLSLANSSHTTKAGTSTSVGFDNAGSSALNKTSVAATRIIMKQFRSPISERIDMSENFALVLPDNLVDAALEINGTKNGLDSAEGNINPQAGRYKIMPYPRLDDTDSNNWHMVNLDLQKKCLFWFDRIKADTNFTVDFHTFMSMVSIYARWSYGFVDWRWIMSHIVS